jgi:hypothetical protein
VNGRRRLSEKSDRGPSARTQRVGQKTANGLNTHRQVEGRLGEDWHRVIVEGGGIGSRRRGADAARQQWRQVRPRLNRREHIAAPTAVGIAPGEAKLP